MTAGRARLAAIVAAAATLGTPAPVGALPVGPLAPLALLMVTSVPRGLTLVADGPLTAAQYASYAPDPGAAAAALRSLTGTHQFSSEVRSWVDPSAKNGIVDLVLALPSAADAQAYAGAQRAALDADVLARRSPIPGVPGGARYAFLTSVPANGVEQLVVLSLGRYVATIRFISLIDAKNPSGFSASQAEVLAMSQFNLLSNAAEPGDTDKSSLGRLFGVVLGAGAVAIVVALVARRRVLGPRPTVPAGVNLPPPPLDPKLSLPMPAAGTPAGWLPDPLNDDGSARYFDGHAWTEQVRQSP